MDIFVLFMIGKRAENSFSPSPADDTDKDDTGEDSDAVNCHIPGRRASARNEGLVVLVEGGESDTEYSRDDHEREASDSVYIERKGYGYCQDEVFRYMTQLAHIVVDAVGIMFDLSPGEILIQHFVCDSDYFEADLIAELTACNTVLCRKLKYHVHDEKGGNK